MNINIVHLLVRTTITFFVLLVSTRLLGKKQLSQLTIFHYITEITIGSVAANVICEENASSFDEIIGLIWWCILTVLIGYLGLKFRKFRKLTDGEPTIVIKRGKILKHSLRSCRLNLDDLSMMLRQQDVFSVKEVEFAILEPHGKLSIYKKQKKQQLLKEDLSIPSHQYKYFQSEIVVDGKLIKHNLEEYGLDEEWLQQQLRQQNIKSIKDILYAELQLDGTLYIQKQN